ncbi:MAG: hypothetical protein ABJA98_27285 [Acidobacteriota bacterium]
MATSLFRTAVLLAAGITLTASPSFAQRDGRRNDGQGERRDTAERAQPRRSGESGARVEPQARSDRGRVESPARDPRARIEAQARGRAESQRRVDPRGRDEARERIQPRRQFDNRRFDNRRFDNRSFGNRRFDNRVYGYRNDGRRTYVVPYGYRPYGYRSGWNLNLYFGRPYSIGGYPEGYGYYAIAPGLAYGAVRIVDAPRDAQVFVDGYYAGVVDDYDGVFQHLNLEAGAHHIEIEAAGYSPFAFDVRIDPGRTMTYHARLF